MSRPHLLTPLVGRHLPSALTHISLPAMASKKASVYAFELLALEEQYMQVEKETHKLEDEIENSKKRRLRLDAEVRFLRRKLKSFRKNPDQDGRVGIAVPAESDDLSDDSDEEQDTRMDSDAPASGMSPNTRAKFLAGQFHEVEVKLANFRTLENGSYRASPIRIESPVEYESDSSLRKYTGKGKVSWQDEEGYSP